MLIFKRKGFSLLELMLVLAIVAALAATAFYTYQKVYDNYKINTAVKQIITLNTVITQAYAGRGNYEGLSPSSISASVPSDMPFDSSSSGFMNTYNFSVGVSASWMTASKANSSGFYISYYVKKEDCFQIVKRLVPAFNYILINSTTAVDNLTGKISDDSTIYSYCISQTGNKYSNLQFYGS